MCLYDDELSLLGLLPLIQLARLFLVLSLPERRAALHFSLDGAKRGLFKALLYTIPAAALIKLVHDWFGFGHQTVCMSRLVFLLGTALFCAALELGGMVTQQAATDDSLDIETRHPWRIWGFRILLGALWVALCRLIRFA